MGSVPEGVHVPITLLWALIWMFTFQQVCVSSVTDYPQINYRLIVSLGAFMEMLIITFAGQSYVKEGSDGAGMWVAMTRITVALALVFNNITCYLFGTTSIKALYRHRSKSAPEWFTTILTFIVTLNTILVIICWGVAFKDSDTFALFVYYVFVDVAMSTAAIVVFIVVYPLRKHLKKVILKAERNMSMTTDTITNGTLVNVPSAADMDTPAANQSNVNIADLKRGKIQMDVILAAMILIIIVMIIQEYMAWTGQKNGDISTPPYDSVGAFIGHVFFAFVMFSAFVAWVYRPSDWCRIRPIDSLFVLCCVCDVDIDSPAMEESALGPKKESNQGTNPDTNPNQHGNSSKEKKMKSAVQLGKREKPKNDDTVLEATTSMLTSDIERSPQAISAKAGGRPSFDTLDIQSMPHLSPSNSHSKKNGGNGYSIDLAIFAFENALSRMEYVTEVVEQLTADIIDNTPMSELNKIMFSNAERLQSLKVFFAGITNNHHSNLKCVALSHNRSDFIRASLTKVGLLEWFGNDGVDFIVASDNDLYKQSEGSLNSIVLKLMQKHNCEHDSVLFVGYQSQDLDNMKALDTCHVYGCKDKIGLSSDDLQKIEKRFFSAVPVSTVTEEA